MARRRFIAKKQHPQELRGPWLIPTLYHRVQSDMPDHTLCPVRALKIYLTAASSRRGDRKGLFVSLQANRQGEISRQLISRWLRNTIFCIVHKSYAQLTFYCAISSRPIVHLHWVTFPFVNNEKFLYNKCCNELPSRFHSIRTEHSTLTYLDYSTSSFTLSKPLCAMRSFE